MQDQEEIFANPVLILLQRLTALNGFVSILENQLDNFRTGFRRAFEESGLDISLAMAGFALGIQDVTGEPDRKFTPYFPVGTFTRQGEEYLAAADELIDKWAGFTIAQVFEAFETYVRDQAAILFWMFPPESPLGNLNYMPIEVAQLPAWQALFRENRWHIFSIMGLFRKQAPALERTERTNILQLRLDEWLSLLASIRHAVTHSDSVLNLSQIRMDRNRANLLLRRHFPGLWTEDSYTLSITTEKTKRGIEIAASYAHLVYKSLAESVGLHGEAVGPKD